MLDKIELWFFKRHVKNCVTQGFNHHRKIRGMYRIIYEAAQDEFYEDNKVTLDAFLTELHKDAQVPVSTLT